MESDRKIGEGREVCHPEVYHLRTQYRVTRSPEKPDEGSEAVDTVECDYQRPLTGLERDARLTVVLAGAVTLHPGECLLYPSLWPHSSL